MVGQPVKIAIRRGVERRRASRGRQAGSDAVDEPPDAAEEAAHPLDPLIAPVEVALGRRREQAEEARRVGAVAPDEVVGVDHVPLRLAHLRAVLDHHPLGEQPAERLVEREEPQVAQHLGEEARVEQVEHGMLDAADVLIDAASSEPVVRLHRVEGHRHRRAASSSARSTRTTARRCPWCRSRGGLRRRSGGSAFVRRPRVPRAASHRAR